jgi:hypothetical protein
MLESIHARHAAERSQERCVVPPSRRHDHRDCSSRDLTIMVRSQSLVFFAGSFTRYVAKHLPTPRTASTRTQSCEIAPERRKAPPQPPLRRACKVFAIDAKRLLHGRPRDAHSPAVPVRPLGTAAEPGSCKPLQLLEMARRGRRPCGGRGPREPASLSKVWTATELPLPASFRRLRLAGWMR